LGAAFFVGVVFATVFLFACAFQKSARSTITGFHFDLMGHYGRTIESSGKNIFGAGGLVGYSLFYPLDLVVEANYTTQSSISNMWLGGGIKISPPFVFLKGLVGSCRQTSETMSSSMYTSGTMMTSSRPFISAGGGLIIPFFLPRVNFLIGADYRIAFFSTAQQTLLASAGIEVGL
jgi:hypothetical protein